MKNIQLKFFFLVFALLFKGICYAQTPGDTMPPTQQQPIPTPQAQSSAPSQPQAAGPTLHDSMRQLYNNMYARKLVVDSSALEYFQNNPDSLYKHSFLEHPPASPTDVEGFAKWRLWLSILLLIVVLGAGIYYAINSAMCRDVSFTSQQVLRPAKERPFSFAKTQLMWWTMIIICCYIYFFGVTGIMVPVNATVGILLGFGTITYASATIIDKRQIIKYGAGNRGNQDTTTCKDFFTDILSDENGISIHRFQALVFNIVFGLGFVSCFIQSLYAHTYPFVTFSDWQYGLLGISSATYLGLKANENSVDTTAASNNGATDTPASATPSATVNAPQTGEGN